MMKFYFFIIVVTAYFGAVVNSSEEVEKLRQTNLLFIMFDDLRPELSMYGREHMITPNFERLAKRSVIFDYAFAQVAVCNPSRDSLLTGLRPDTVGVYNFQNSFYPHLIFPAELVESGYKTAGIGKIRHWDGADAAIWNFDHWNNDWYTYQAHENSFMNSSTMPDKVRKEESFRDYLFSSRAIKTLEKLIKLPNYYMLAVGFKLPHLAVHVPFKYYEMYKKHTQAWKLSKKELRFPASTSEVSYRGCAEPEFKFMRGEGSQRYNRTVPLGDVSFAFTDEMHNELMIGYSAAVTFVDKQLGRLLDVLDKYDLWSNLTVVLTADHGMHNGEKGIWFLFIKNIILFVFVL
jgi:arylsulfatase A-like enzyme